MVRRPHPRSARHGRGALRLLAGSQILLLIQSLLVLASPIDLGPLRLGMTAVCAVAGISLAWILTDMCRLLHANSGRSTDGN